MRVILGVPNADLAEDARSLWRELKTIASPFPFECSDDDLQVLWEQTGCDIEVPSLFRHGELATPDELGGGGEFAGVANSSTSHMTCNWDALARSPSH